MNIHNVVSTGSPEVGDASLIVVLLAAVGFGVWFLIRRAKLKAKQDLLDKIRAERDRQDRLDFALEQKFQDEVRSKKESEVAMRLAVLSIPRSSVPSEPPTTRPAVPRPRKKEIR